MDEGRTYLGSSVANAAGAFDFQKVCPIPYPNLTATTTDLDGSTSPFSSPQVIPWDCSSPNPVPSLVDTDPSAITASGGNSTFLLRLNGSGFIPVSKVLWDEVELAIVSHTPTQISAIVPSGLVSFQGSVDISVSNPEPGGGLSNKLTFTILPPKRIYLPLVVR